MRVHQWVKNTFIFIPILFSGLLSDSGLFFKGIIAFGFFSIAASAVYIFNDLLDLERDKLHPTKKNRPIASGRISYRTAILLSIFFAVTAISGSAIFLVREVAYLIVAYTIVNILYSLWLKKIVLLDAFVVSSGYVIRIFVGSLIINLPPSHWILLMTFFLSLLIIFGKRRSELTEMKDESTRHRPVLKSYSLNFLDHIISMQLALVILYYTLYTFSENALRFGDYLLTYTVPFVAYGCLRYFYLIQVKGEGGEPSKTLFSDSQLLICVLLWALSVSAIIYKF